MSDTFHPLAGLFPLMQGEAFDRLVEDVRENGLIEPITLLDGLVLDGRNRSRACVATGVPPRFVVYEGSDPAAFIVSANLHRRHLDASQCAMIAARMATMREGRPNTASNEAVSQADAAKLMGVSRSSVQRAKAVQDKAIPALAEAVEHSAIPLDVAAKLASLPEAIQQRAVDQPDKAPHLIKLAAREQRVNELAERTEAESQRLAEQRYPVIYCDPPWHFETFSDETGMDRHASNHYPTMTIDQIAEIEPPFAVDCALFLWATIPHLPLAMRLIARWGFSYKSALAWHKPGTGTGYWTTRDQIELLLIATRGDIPAPAPGSQPPQMTTAPRMKHSEKPEVFAQYIEAMFPDLPRLEMFARLQRPGWASWGNQS